MAKKVKKPKRPKPYRAIRFGILNPYGDVWTPETFDTEDAAKRYVTEWWKQVGGPRADKFKIVRARVTVSAVL